MKSIKLNYGAYEGYKQLLDMMSIGINLMIVIVFSDFIFFSLKFNDNFNQVTLKDILVIPSMKDTTDLYKRDKLLK